MKSQDVLFLRVRFVCAHIKPANQHNLAFCFAEAPKLDLSTLAGRAIKVRAGEPIKIDIPIIGSPTPTVTWSKDGKDVPNGPKVRETCMNE